MNKDANIKVANLIKIHKSLFCRNPHLNLRMTAPMERIQTLDAIEKDIILCLQSAGRSILVTYLYKCRSMLLSCTISLFSYIIYKLSKIFLKSWITYFSVVFVSEVEGHTNFISLDLHQFIGLFILIVIAYGILYYCIYLNQ